MILTKELKLCKESKKKGGNGGKGGLGSKRRPTVIPESPTFLLIRAT